MLLSVGIRPARNSWKCNIKCSSKHFKNPLVSGLKNVGKMMHHPLWRKILRNQICLIFERTFAMIYENPLHFFCIVVGFRKQRV
jgi:hypothetical protein